MESDTPAQQPTSLTQGPLGHGARHRDDQKATTEKSRGTFCGEQLSAAFDRVMTHHDVAVAPGPWPLEQSQ